jgi:hypothetical protein
MKVARTAATFGLTMALAGFGDLPSWAAEDASAPHITNPSVVTMPSGDEMAKAYPASAEAKRLAFRSRNRAIRAALPVTTIVEQGKWLTVMATVRRAASAWG